MEIRNWQVAIAGEAMASRPFSMYDEPEFLEMIKLLRNADFAYAHMEGNYGDIEELQWPHRGEQSGSFFIADPRIVDDLKWAGVDIVSNAMNHSMDFGPSGILATRRHCKRAGLVCAGTGRDLEEAMAPAYLETKRGRVALVSMSSGNRREDWASLPKGGTLGRPGINPLRAFIKWVVDQQTAEQLKEMGRKLKVLRTPENVSGGLGREHRVKDGIGIEAGEFILGGAITGGGTVYIEGDRLELTSTVHEKDLERNCRAVDEAMKMADLVLVGHHCNLSEGPRGDHPPQFMRTAAQAFIDAGADIYLGHGWHRTLGIEIYQGKPIFYGLGNFFAQNEFVLNVPYDSFESWGHDLDRLPTLNPATFPLHPAEPGETWWSSAIAVIEMEGHKMTGMKLYPVEMGRDASPEARIKRRTGSGPDVLTEGRPLMADKENGQKILERLQRLSAELGTEIDIKDGIGVVKIK